MLLSLRKNGLTSLFKEVRVFKAILGPQMAAPILWAPGIFWFFLLENPHAHKIPPFRGGFWVFLEGGGGSANFISMGVGIFLSFCKKSFPKL